jgi:hypothetical protein
LRLMQKFVLQGRIFYSMRYIFLFLIPKLFANNDYIDIRRQRFLPQNGRNITDTCTAGAIHAGP